MMNKKDNYKYSFVFFYKNRQHYLDIKISINF